MRRTIGILALLLLTILGSVVDPVHAGYALDQVISGLETPAYVTSPPGDTDRLFINELPGRIRIIDNGVLDPVPFLDVTDLTVFGIGITKPLSCFVLSWESSN